MENNLNTASLSLRKKAEKLLKSNLSSSGLTSMNAEARLLIEEFLAHQSALEKQNTELIKAESEFYKERQYLNDIFSNYLFL